MSSATRARGSISSRAGTAVRPLHGLARVSRADVRATAATAMDERAKELSMQFSG
jgi:hypothetical protein